MMGCLIDICMHGVQVLMLGKGVWLLQQVVQLPQGQPPQGQAVAHVLHMPWPPPASCLLHS